MSHPDPRHSKLCESSSTLAGPHAAEAADRYPPDFHRTPLSASPKARAWFRSLAWWKQCLDCQRFTPGRRKPARRVSAAIAQKTPVACPTILVLVHGLHGADSPERSARVFGLPECDAAYARARAAAERNSRRAAPEPLDAGRSGASARPIRRPRRDPASMVCAPPGSAWCRSRAGQLTAGVGSSRCSCTQSSR